jgi:hypothetical protein
MERQLLLAVHQSLALVELMQNQQMTEIRDQAARVKDHGDFRKAFEEETKQAAELAYARQRSHVLLKQQGGSQHASFSRVYNAFFDYTGDSLVPSNGGEKVRGGKRRFFEVCWKMLQEYYCVIGKPTDLTAMTRVKLPADCTLHSKEWLSGKIPGDEWVCAKDLFRPEFPYGKKTSKVDMTRLVHQAIDNQLFPVAFTQFKKFFKQAEPIPCSRSV